MENIEDKKEAEVVDEVESFLPSNSTNSMTLEEESRLKTMMEAGVFYGLAKSKTNPKMKPYIMCTKSDVEIIDLLKTIEALDRSVEALKEKVKSGGTPLFIGTTSAAKSLIKEMAIRLRVPYVTERWLGGTLTNFKTISQRINYFKKLKEDKATHNLEKYTKKERIGIEQELTKLERLFGGIETLDKLPSILVISDLGENKTAAREARRMKMPVIAFVNTNCDPTIVDYPIPANNRNTKSIELLLAYLEKAVADVEKEAMISQESKEVNV